MSCILFTLDRVSGKSHRIEVLVYAFCVSKVLCIAVSAFFCMHLGLPMWYLHHILLSPFLYMSIAFV